MSTDRHRGRRSHASQALIQIDDVRRNRIERAIEALLGFLDALDAPGADLEPDVDEEESDFNELGSDDEPSLGAPEPTYDRMKRILWGRGSDDNRELAAEVPFQSRPPPALAPPEAPALMEIVPDITIRFADPEMRLFVDTAGRSYVIPPEHQLAPLRPEEWLLVGTDGTQYRFARGAHVPACERAA